MTYSIIYSSRSGNTKQLANTIYDLLNEHNKTILGSTCINEPDTTDETLKTLSNASCIFIGFWTDKGSCEESLQQLLQTLEHKTIFLFGTAGFGGSKPYFDTILNRVSSLCSPTNTIIGTYRCQGKMPSSVRSRYEQMKAKNPEDNKWDMMIENFDHASSHPDMNDIEQLKRSILPIL